MSEELSETEKTVVVERHNRCQSIAKQLCEIDLAEGGYGRGYLIQLEEGADYKVHLRRLKDGEERSF